MRLLLDTSDYIAMRRGSEALRRLFHRSVEVALSMIGFGEILYGFHRGRQLDQNLEQLERFLARPSVRLLPVTRATADRYARVAAGLWRTGRPIPTNDIWIAAQALETSADLVSTDTHFGEVDGLVWIPLSG